MNVTPETHPAENSISTQRQFYARVVSLADLEEARQLEGLEEEIAVLRAQLRDAMDGNPEALEVMSQHLGMLVKAVAAQHRMSPRAKREFMEGLTSVLNNICDLLLPADP